MGLLEILPSHLSTVQKDHHSPTYWSLSCIILWVILKTASLFKKTPQNSTQPIHPGSDNTSTPELRARGVQHSKEHGKPLCLSSGCAVVWTMWVYWVLGMSVSKNKNTDPDLRLCRVPQHWGQRPKWELLLVILMVFLSLVLRHPAQKLSMSLHKLCTLIYA